MCADIVGEKEHLQYGKDDEQLNQDDGPERAPQRHLAKAVPIEVESLV
jgi:hypothetical protein